ncbi:MAG: hypothetical protein JXR77_08090 [Lentisphaeria bacterium]|nr:hypothetical protein [Lentisphaeria bacterium]
MAFEALSGALGLALIACGIAGLQGRALAHPALPRLPRLRVAGEIIGLICLVWSAYYGCQLLEGGLAVHRKLVWALVPVAAVLAYGYLDYLFARSLGGLLVLCASFLLHGAFVADLPVRPAYACVCYAVGSGGLLLVGVPWRFRDLLLAMGQSKPCRHTVAALCVLAGAVFAIMPFLA